MLWYEAEGVTLVSKVGVRDRDICKEKRTEVDERPPQAQKMLALPTSPYVVFIIKVTAM
jgi:hypothetical protein